MNTRAAKYSIVLNDSKLICFVAIIVAFVNSVCYANKYLSLGFVIFEVIILLYLFCRSKYLDYLGMYILFCGLSIEYGDLVANEFFYGFKNTRILGINLGILTLIPLFLVSIKYITRHNGVKLDKFRNYYLLMQLFAAIIGLILILLDENNIQKFDNIFVMYVNNIYSMCVQPIMLLTIFIMLIHRCEYIEKLEDYFLYLMMGVVFSLIFSLAIGAGGTYGGVSTLLASNNMRWLPLMLILPIYPQYKGRLSIWILGTIGAILVLAFNATGKMVIMYALLPLIYLFLNVKTKQYKSVLLILLLIPVFMLLFYYGAKYLAATSTLFRSKLNQALSVLGLLTGRIKTGQVLISPQIRINETLNIIYEYMEKPWLLPFGKGFMGTIKNYTGITYALGAYSQEEWTAGLFYRMHESLNKILLPNGLFGISFLVIQLVNGFKNISKTPWGSIGLYWLLISYGHSITMTAFGFMCLIYSVMQADKVNGKHKFK